LIEHRQIDVAAEADRSPTITGIDAKSVAGAFTPLKPVFFNSLLYRYAAARTGVSLDNTTQ
jgi:hypothetical protein